MEENQTQGWRAGLAELWKGVKAGPQQCKPQACTGAVTKAGKDKNLGKEIGLIYGASLILNTIIGPGIFTSPKGVLSGAGSVGMSIVIWAICGVFSTMAALCFVELRESVRKDGVEYAYITEAFGPLAGFVYCWMRIAAAEPVGTAVFAVALADYTADTIYDDCGPPEMLRKSIAVLAVVSLALLNVFSQKLADRMQVLASVGKTCAIVVILYFGIRNVFRGETEEIKRGFDDTVTSPTRITFAFYNGLWAYGGWSNVNHVTSGLKKPPRNLPRLVKFVIPLVMLIYIAVVTSYFTVMSREDMLASEAIGVTWAERVFGNEAMAVIPIGVGLTALGSLNGTFLSAGRLSGVASKDKQMPEVTSWVHVRSKTPILTVYTRLTISIIMILVAEISELVRFFIFCVWSFHGMSILALLVLRFKNKDKRRPYKVNIVLPVIVVVVIGFLLIGPFLEEPQPEFISALVLFVLSLLCYLPSHWVSDRASMPDKFIIWLQLFFRIAPKREMRRKSILRRMSNLAGLGRGSIFVPGSTSPQAISPSLLRRMSRVSLASASPTTYRRNPTSPTIIRRVVRHRSLAEADLKRGRSGSRVAWLESGAKGSPTLVRRRPSRQSQSFGAADGVPNSRAQNLPKLVSLPNLQALLAKELDKPQAAPNNAYTPPPCIKDDNRNVKRAALPPKPEPAAPSPILTNTSTKTKGGARGRGVAGLLDRKNSTEGGANNGSGGGSPVISTLYLPPGVRRASLPQRGLYAGVSAPRRLLPLPGRPPSNNTLNNARPRNSSTQSLPINTRQPPPSAIPEEGVVNGDGAAPPGPAPSNHAPLADTPSAALSEDMDVVGGFESEGGGEYEILTLPPLSLAELAERASRATLTSNSSDSSDSDSSDDDWDDFRGLGSLFDSSTESTSSSTTSMDEDGSLSDADGGFYYASDELDSDLDEVVFTGQDDQSNSYV